MGYSAVQFSGGGFGTADAKELARITGDLGLTVASTHTGWDRFRNELDAVITEHKTYGCSAPAIGGVPQEYRSAEGARRFADEVAPIVARLAKEGMSFSYHNHNMEFARFGARPAGTGLRRCPWAVLRA